MQLQRKKAAAALPAAAVEEDRDELGLLEDELGRPDEELGRPDELERLDEELGLPVVRGDMVVDPEPPNPVLLPPLLPLPSNCKYPSLSGAANGPEMEAIGGLLSIPIVSQAHTETLPFVETARTIREYEPSS